MKDTVDTQKAMMQGVSLDQMHDVMDDMRNIKEDQEELNEAMARNYDVEVDDEELDAGNNIIFIKYKELDELDHQMRIDLDVNTLCAPNKRILSKKEEDEKELENMLK